MKNLEDFTHSELVERKNLQASLHEVLMSLKTALDSQEFEAAILHNIRGSRILKAMITRELTLPGESDMLDTLQNNINDILRLQHRNQ